MPNPAKEFFKHFETIQESDFKDAKTFEKWLENGRCVMKGEKCIGRNRKGVPLFAKRQTSLLIRRHRGCFADYDDTFGDIDDDRDSMGLNIVDTF